MTLQFDTLKAVKSLKEAGFDQDQAEAVVTTVGGALESNVATRQDVEKTELSLRGEIAEKTGELRGEMSDLRGEIAELRGEVRSEIANLKAEIFRQLWIMGGSIVGVIVVLDKLL